MSPDRERRGCLEHTYHEARADAGLVRRVCAVCGRVEVELDLRSPRRWEGLRRAWRRLWGRRSPRPGPLGPPCDHCRRPATVRTREGFLCARCAIEALPRGQRRTAE